MLISINGFKFIHHQTKLNIVNKDYKQTILSLPN
jgi:hypothetical protein